MPELTDRTEFEPVHPDVPESVSRFLELGRPYLLEADNTPADINEKFLESIIRRQGEADRWLLLLKLNDDPIGLVHFKIDRGEYPDDYPGWGDILEYYIIPHMRRRGLGTRMFGHVAGILKSRGVKDVWLASHKDYEGFWEAVGFSRTGKKLRTQNIMTIHLY